MVRPKRIIEDMPRPHAEADALISLHTAAPQSVGVKGMAFGIVGLSRAGTGRDRGWPHQAQAFAIAR